MAGLSKLAAENDIPLRPQGAGLVFHATMLKPGCAGGGDLELPRLRGAAGCTALGAPAALPAGGRRARHRGGLWFISLAHTQADIDEALQRAALAFARHAADWKAPC